MREPRLYVDSNLASNELFSLPKDSAHHVSRVLRMRSGQRLWLFNGQGSSQLAEIVEIDRRQVQVRLVGEQEEGRESKLELTLCQCVSRAQHMDYTLQKAVELGVTRIVPILSEFSNVRIAEDRQDTKLNHWRQVIISATEQCGRSRLAELEAPMSLEDWFGMDKNQVRLILHPGAAKNFGDITPTSSQVTILCGPEGGLSEDEVKSALAQGYIEVAMGPRILRTETAPVAALSVCQFLWGDLN